MDPSLFTRDWHLQDLALERLGLDDLDAGDAQAVRDHLTQCRPCQQRFEAIQSELAEPLPVLVLERKAGAELVRDQQQRDAEIIPLHVRRVRMFAGGVGAVVAMAAALLVVFLPQVQDQLDPEFQARGSELSFEVWRQDGEEAVLTHDGDGVRSGDRLAFRVSNRDAGHLLVVGIDSQLEPYPCFPPDATVGSAPWEASPALTQLASAIELDATPGQERIVALLCQQPTDLASVAPLLRDAASSTAEWDDLPEIVPGCLQRELRLHKLEKEAP